MSDPQDAIHRAIPVMREEMSGAMYEAKTSAGIEGYVVDVADWRTITKAARRVANPDIEAATVITNGLRFVKAGDEWDDLIYDITKEAVDAALSVTEDVSRCHGGRMSDLQDALRRHDLWWSGSNDHQRHKDRQMFVEAARKYANPDIDAAHQARLDGETTAEVVDAALSVTENE